MELKSEQTTILKERVAELIDLLLKLNGSNGQLCSFNHLAKVINHISPPKNAIGDWLYGKREPDSKYLTRFTEILNICCPEINISYLELILYLHGNKYATNIVEFKHDDYLDSVTMLRNLKSIKKVESSYFEPSIEIMSNLTLSNLWRLHYLLQQKSAFTHTENIVYLYEVKSLILTQLLHKNIAIAHLSHLIKVNYATDIEVPVNLIQSQSHMSIHRN